MRRLGLDSWTAAEADDHLWAIEKFENCAADRYCCRMESPLNIAGPMREAEYDIELIVSLFDGCLQLNDDNGKEESAVAVVKGCELCVGKHVSFGLRLRAEFGGTKFDSTRFPVD